ncbi:MAG: DNA-binding protein [Candidatus Komeilibacteria bacterium RIFCSPLOWO2_01_FULL_52_15]|uniref:Viral histone-like protein n=2 Tax=Candidatus Komeiliibacteriota TaxID=1817908 RepID=A0A1G2BS50_9BACT|nr:MAG: DNA-binding protein [Candidatus Komeilibacteria bacterium RIFCSPHIGHO2_01_FULL_52_14]OGY91220.1 MAG: DNA-binding protein [Candidatus Komeilibacteria bacterium RIFCSPLOWO2_01_FULL_52_15]
MAKMTKSQILQALAEKTGHTKKDIAALLDAIVEMAYSEVKKSGEFALAGIGKLVKVNRKARMGRNPATGETISIPAKTVVKFRVAKAAKEAVL